MSKSRSVPRDGSAESKPTIRRGHGFPWRVIHPVVTFLCSRPDRRVSTNSVPDVLGRERQTSGLGRQS